MGGRVSKLVDSWTRWGFRILFSMVVGFIVWHGNDLYGRFDKVDETFRKLEQSFDGKLEDQGKAIQKIEIDFAEQRSKVDTQLQGVRDGLLDIKSRLIELDRKLDRDRELKP